MMVDPSVSMTVRVCSWLWRRCGGCRILMSLGTIVAMVGSLLSDLMIFALREGSVSE